MALPKLLQKLFTNGGAGDKLNQDIIPDIPYSKVTDAPSVDSALSSTSENPVQNKVINSALDGKLSTSGGTVNGPVTIASTITTSELARPAGVKEFYIWGKDNDGCLQLYPGETASFSAKKTASLLLATTGYTGNSIGVGSFVLSAMDATTGAKSLSGQPDGSLTWCGEPVWFGKAIWANRTNLTIGQSFTAPSRGFVYSKANSTSSWGALHTSVNGIHILGVTGKETDTGGTVYVNAGDTVIVSGDGSVKNVSAIFVPIL